MAAIDLGGMSLGAAENNLNSLRERLYREGAKHNSDVVAINTAIALIQEKQQALSGDHICLMSVGMSGDCIICGNKVID